MKKFALLLVTLMVAFVTIQSCAKQTDEPKKEQATELNASYSPSVQGAEVILTAYEQDASVIMVADAGTGDTEKKFDFATILNVVLGVISVVLGAILAKFKVKLRQLLDFGTALIEGGVEVDKALADNNISKDEIIQLRAKYTTVRETFKALISFKKQE